MGLVYYLAAVSQRKVGNKTLVFMTFCLVNSAKYTLDCCTSDAIFTQRDDSYALSPQRDVKLLNSSDLFTTVLILEYNYIFVKVA